MLYLQKLSKHYTIVAFIVLYAIFSFLTYKQYGITSDEQLDYQNGKLLLEYFSKPTSPSTTLREILKMDEKSQIISSPLFSPYGRGYLVILNILNPLGYYEWFHLLNMLFAVVLFAAIYFVIFTQTENIWLSLLGPMFLVLTPSFFGHIPANAKDMPFAILYYLSLISIYYFSKKESDARFTAILVLGVLFGVTQSMRVVGFSLYIIYLLQNLLFEKKQLNLRFVQELVLTTITSLFIMMLQWPYVGMNFFQNLKSALVNSSFFYLWNKQILFIGEFLLRDARPWYYLPFWFLITTPLFLLVLFVIPFFVKKFYSNKLIVYLHTSLLVNFLVYLILNPVIYNGIRHFLFFIPIASTISAITFSEIYKSLCCRNLKIFVLSLLFMGLLPVILSTVSLFPFHYVYFNELVGGTSNAYKKFDLDYWGASYTKTAEYFRDNIATSGTKYKVYACNNGFAVDYVSYKKFEVTIVRDLADYIICDVTSDMQRNYKGDVVYTLYKNNTPFNLIRQNVKSL